MFGMIVILLVITAGVALTIYQYNKTIEELRSENNELLVTIEDYENNMTDVYALTKDVKSGSTVEAYDISLIEVPLDAVPENAITDLSQLENKQYKIDLSVYTYLTEEMLMEGILTDDMRELDLVLDEVPIGLEIGDYVDIRISFPLGEDFIAMSHKRVVGIFDNVIKLVINQQDFYTYEGMKTDSAIYSTTKLYAARYVEAGLQQASQTYYPVSLDILETMLLDPNIDTSDFSMVMDNRLQLETQLCTSDKVDINDTVTHSKEKILDTFDNARKTYEKLQQKKESANANSSNASE